MKISQAIVHTATHKTTHTVIHAAVLATVIASAFMSPVSQAQKITVEECQKLKDKIERYDNQRRAGGSGKQMDAWKRSRRESEQVYSKSDCWRYGRKLK
ncbi:MAG: hypothetical protein V7742_20925 [Halioglobus sp.]